MYRNLTQNQCGFLAYLLALIRCTGARCGDGPFSRFCHFSSLARSFAHSLLVPLLLCSLHPESISLSIVPCGSKRHSLFPVCTLPHSLSVFPLNFTHLAKWHCDFSNTPRSSQQQRPQQQRLQNRNPNNTHNIHTVANSEQWRSENCVCCTKSI